MTVCKQYLTKLNVLKISQHSHLIIKTWGSVTRSATFQIMKWESSPPPELDSELRCSHLILWPPSTPDSAVLNDLENVHRTEYFYVKRGRLVCGVLRWEQTPASTHGKGTNHRRDSTAVRTAKIYSGQLKNEMIDVVSCSGGSMSLRGRREGVRRARCERAELNNYFHWRADLSSTLV